VLASGDGVERAPVPSHKRRFTDKDDYLPVHNFVIAALGVTVVDDLDLERR